jgi:hypothetical protein
MKGEPLMPLYFGPGEQMKQNNCPVTNCEITNNRDELPNSDLVLFHLRNEIDYVPTRAFATQSFVHVIYESPVNCHKCTVYNTTIFNYSATYTIDSDFTSIYWTDSGLYWELNEKFDLNADFTANKTGLAAALISNCIHENSGRNDYITELARHMSVKTYGKCGEPCPVVVANCIEYISQNFKFFLAFENTLCKGYVTEKFFDWLNFDIVPVVLGLGDYSYYVPRSAYVNVLDFKSPFELARYLSYLDGNATAYNEFFKWKRFVKSEYFAERRRFNGFLCEMCIQLQLELATGEQVMDKRVTDVERRFGLAENCKVGELEWPSGEFSVKKSDHLIYNLFMSSEIW